MSGFIVPALLVVGLTLGHTVRPLQRHPIPTQTQSPEYICHAFRLRFGGIFREYVSVSEPEYLERRKQWDSFCIKFNRTSPTTLRGRDLVDAESEAVQAQWAAYTSYLPLSACRLEKQDRSGAAATTTTPTEASTTSRLPEPNETTSSSVPPPAATTLDPAAACETGSKSSTTGPGGVIRICADVIEVSAICIAAMYVAVRRYMRGGVYHVPRADASH